MLAILPATLTVVFLTQHVVNYSGEIRSFVATLWTLCTDFINRHPSSNGDAKNCPQQERKRKVEAALWDARARTYRQCVQFFVHVASFGCIGMMNDLCWNPSWTQFFHLFSMFSVYVAHHCVCKEKITLNARNLRGIYVVFYTSFTFFVLSNFHRQTYHERRAIIDQGFNAGGRMIMSVVFFDTLTTVPAQLLISAAETAVYAQHYTMQETALFGWMQLILVAGIISFSAVLEYCITSHLGSLMDTEAMVVSFRRMLRGVSDGEVMLTHDMRIAEESNCLKHLLMTQSAFKGKDFQRLVEPDEVERFQEFINQSMAEAQKPEDQRTTTPPCLRISLRGASDLRVAVDLWHVGMPGPKDGALHLLALREDSEAARCHVVSQGHVGHHVVQPCSPTSTDAPEDCGLSQTSSTSMLTSFPELVQMTLCVDTSTHWFDVEQAHLSFSRQPQSSDHSMPSLRRLIRPSDWETVRAQLKAVEDGASEEMTLRLVDDAHRSMIAKQVQVSTFHSPLDKGESIKLCLQLGEIVFDDTKLQPNLMAIHE